MSSALLTPIIAIVTGLILFAGMWTLITRLLAGLSGWGRLARKFAAGVRPAGELLTGQILALGPVRENNVTRVIASEGGLFLFPNRLFTLGRIPLLIPYDRFRYLDSKTVLWARSHEIEVDGAVTMRIRDPLLAALKSHGVSVAPDALA